jgi:hypothetical protein
MFVIPELWSQSSPLPPPSPSGTVTLIDPNHTIYLGRPASSAKKMPPNETTPVETPKTIPIDFDSSPNTNEVRAALSVRFAPDSERNLPGLLMRYQGGIGFGDDTLLSRIFVPQNGDWGPAGIGAAVPLDDYYYLRIDERAGRYPFVDRLRRSHRDLAGSTAYALFPMVVQLRIEHAIRASTGFRQCHEGQAVEAVVHLAESGFQLRSLSCHAGDGKEPPR